MYNAMTWYPGSRIIESKKQGYTDAPRTQWIMYARMELIWQADVIAS
jgi:hypothetical protein